MDKWDSALLRGMEEMGGNVKCNQYWEAKLITGDESDLLHWKKPTSSSTL